MPVPIPSSSSRSCEMPPAPSAPLIDLFSPLPNHSQPQARSLRFAPRIYRPGRFSKPRAAALGGMRTPSVSTEIPALARLLQQLGPLRVDALNGLALRPCQIGHCPEIPTRRRCASTNKPEAKVTYYRSQNER